MVKLPTLIVAASAFTLGLVGCGGAAVPTSPSPPLQPATTHALAGVVTETAPTESTPIPNARVEVVSGSSVGAFSNTDDNGHYSLAGLSGSLELRIVKEGYETTGATLSGLNANTRLDFAVKPVFRVVRDTFADCILPSGSAISHFVAVHHSGTLRADADWTGSDAFISMELWRGGIRIADAYARPARPVQLSAEVVGGAHYELRMSGDPDMHYTLIVTRPN